MQQAAHALVLVRLPDAYSLRSAAGSPQLELAKTSWGIKGQRSGITWRYFLMLIGVPRVKPDRMIHRFLTETLGRTVSNEEAVALITLAASELDIDPTEADHRIWKHAP